MVIDVYLKQPDKPARKVRFQTDPSKAHNTLKRKQKLAWKPVYNGLVLIYYPDIQGSGFPNIEVEGVMYDGTVYLASDDGTGNPTDIALSSR